MTTDKTNIDQDFEIVKGTGNVFADLGLPNAKLEQLRAILAAEIGNTLTAKGWGVREAERQTGVQAADYSRIRNANLGRFTIDRLMTILDKLNREVEVNITVLPRDPNAHGYVVLHPA
jgi:predicted XRE-type DNA-binding protein